MLQLTTAASDMPIEPNVCKIDTIVQLSCCTGHLFHELDTKFDECIVYCVKVGRMAFIGIWSRTLLEGALGRFSVVLPLPRISNLPTRGSRYSIHLRFYTLSPARGGDPIHLHGIPPSPRIYSLPKKVASHDRGLLDLHGIPHVISPRGATHRGRTPFINMVSFSPLEGFIDAMLPHIEGKKGRTRLLCSSATEKDP